MAAYRLYTIREYNIIVHARVIMYNVILQYYTKPKLINIEAFILHRLNKRKKNNFELIICIGKQFYNITTESLYFKCAFTVHFIQYTYYTGMTYMHITFTLIV